MSASISRCIIDMAFMHTLSLHNIPFPIRVGLQVGQPVFDCCVTLKMISCSSFLVEGNLGQYLKELYGNKQTNNVSHMADKTTT